MPFRSIRMLDGPLWVAGPREAQPEGTLRLGAGLSLTPNAKVAKSRAGSTLLFANANIIPLTSFSTIIIGRTAPDLVDCSNGSPILTGLSRNLGFAIGPSVQDNAATAGDYFFHADTTGMRKIRHTTFAVSQWGIDAPVSVVEGVPQTQLMTVIDPLDGTTVGSWSGDADVNTGPSTETTVQTDGASMKFHVVVNGTGTVTRNLGSPLDLTVVGTDPSPDEDWIQMAIRFDRPRHVDSVKMILGVDVNFNQSFSFDILVDDRVSKSRQRGQKRKGLADLVPVTNDEQEFKATVPGEAFKIEAADLLGDTVASVGDETWAILKIPKLVFTKNGDGTFDWSSIAALRLVVKTNRKGGVQVYVDDWKLVGGVGMQGDYKLRVTFKNAVTGHRSNGSVESFAQPSDRQKILWQFIPTSTDAQVDTRELWRTLGNGSVFFHLVDIPDNTTTTFLDDYADYAGLHGLTSRVLGDEVLPEDNAPPLPEYGRPAIHQDRMWWAIGRRAYYSPPGRYESVEGFLDVGTNNDPIIAPIRWDDQLFLFCTQSVYIVLGTDVPFITRKVPGVPGIVDFGSLAVWPLVAMPQGIVYDTAAGPRLMRGASSQLLDPDGMASVFQDHLDVDGIVGSTAHRSFTAARDRLYITTTPPTTTLVYDFTVGWRNLGLATSGGWYDREEDRAYLTAAGIGIVIFGDPTVEGDGVPIGGGPAVAPVAFTWEPAPIAVDADRQAGLIRYVAFTIATAGQLLTPTILVDGVERALPPIATDVISTVEYPINQWGRVVSARLTGSLLAPIQIAEVAFDVYLPETHGIIAPSVDVPSPKGTPVAPDAPDGTGESA